MRTHLTLCAASAALAVLLPGLAGAQTQPAAAGAPVAVTQAPVTFGGTGVAPKTAANGDPRMARYRADDAIHAARAAQERAFVAKFGYGRPVHLRARRY